VSVVAKAWACLCKDVRIEASYRLAFAIDALDGVLMLVAYGFLAGVFGDQRLDGYAPLGFMLVGVATNGAMMTALVTFAHAVRGVQSAGAMKAALATPTPFVALVSYSSIYPFLRAGLDLVVWLLVAAALGAAMGALSVSGVVAVGVVFVAAALAMAGFGFLAAAFAVVFKRGDPVLWLFGAASLVLSGVLYPTSVLPPALAALSMWLPATHALEAMRAILLGGAGLSDVTGSLLALCAFGVVGVPLGVGALVQSVRYARQEGTLGHV
jgi:ABC-2 type transport system permease protein